MMEEWQFWEPLKISNQECSAFYSGNWIEMEKKSGPLSLEMETIKYQGNW